MLARTFHNLMCHQPSPKPTASIPPPLFGNGPGENGHNCPKADEHYQLPRDPEPTSKGQPTQHPWQLRNHPTRQPSPPHRSGTSIDLNGREQVHDHHPFRISGHTLGCHWLCQCLSYVNPKLQQEDHGSKEYPSPVVSVVHQGSNGPMTTSNRWPSDTIHASPDSRECSRSHG